MEKIENSIKCFDESHNYDGTINEAKIIKFLINDNKKHDFAIVLPGGAYNDVCPLKEGDLIAKKLNELGYNAFVIYYRVRELASYPNPLMDVINSFKYIENHKEEFSLTDNYLVIGSSAGGHLATLFARSDLGYKKFGLLKPKGLILVYPVVTLKEGTHELSRDNLIGNNNKEEYIELLSNESHISSDFPKTFMIAGCDDEIVNPYKNSCVLKKKLDEENVKNEFRLFEHFYHGAGLGEDTLANGWFEEAIKFLEDR